MPKTPKNPAREAVQLPWLEVKSTAPVWPVKKGFDPAQVDPRKGTRVKRKAMKRPAMPRKTKGL